MGRVWRRSCDGPIMEKSDGKDSTTVVCRNMLRHERAAVEIYELAARLLDSNLGGPDYFQLMESHRSQVDEIESFLADRHERIDATVVGWDRPHRAVLSAATIYGADSPISQLLEQEREICSLYESLLESRFACPELRDRVSQVLLPRAMEALAMIEAEPVAAEASFDQRVSA